MTKKLQKAPQPSLWVVPPRVGKTRGLLQSDGIGCLDWNKRAQVELPKSFLTNKGTKVE